MTISGCVFIFNKFVVVAKFNKWRYSALWICNSILKFVKITKCIWIIITNSIWRKFKNWIEIERNIVVVNCISIYIFNKSFWRNFNSIVNIKISVYVIWCEHFWVVWVKRINSVSCVETNKFSSKHNMNIALNFKELVIFNNHINISAKCSNRVSDWLISVKCRVAITRVLELSKCSVVWIEISQNYINWSVISKSINICFVTPRFNNFVWLCCIFCAINQNCFLWIIKVNIESIVNWLEEIPTCKLVTVWNSKFNFTTFIHFIFRNEQVKRLRISNVNCIVWWIR